jgi:hypothetical protein
MGAACKDGIKSIYPIWGVKFLYTGRSITDVKLYGFLRIFSRFCTPNERFKIGWALGLLNWLLY